MKILLLLTFFMAQNLLSLELPITTAADLYHTFKELQQKGEARHTLTLPMVESQTTALIGLDKNSISKPQVSLLLLPIQIDYMLNDNLLSKNPEALECSFIINNEYGVGTILSQDSQSSTITPLLNVVSVLKGQVQGTLYIDYSQLKKLESAPDPIKTLAELLSQIISQTAVSAEGTIIIGSPMQQMKIDHYSPTFTFQGSLTTQSIAHVQIHLGARISPQVGFLAKRKHHQIYELALERHKQKLPSLYFIPETSTIGLNLTNQF